MPKIQYQNQNMAFDQPYYTFLFTIEHIAPGAPSMVLGVFMVFWALTTKFWRLLLSHVSHVRLCATP